METGQASSSWVLGRHRAGTSSFKLETVSLGHVPLSVRRPAYLHVYPDLSTDDYRYPLHLGLR